MHPMVLDLDLVDLTHPEVLHNEFWLNSGNPFGLGSWRSLGVSDTFNKEVSKSFELGFKGRYLDGRLEVNGAIFETDVDDNQFFEFFAGPWGSLKSCNAI